MEQQYLVDTNTAIDYLNNSLPDTAANLIDKEQVVLSVISRMELLAWSAAPSDQIALLEEFINEAIVLNLDEPIIIKGIEIRKNYRIKLPDAIIAATALVNNFTLLTRNVADFKKIAGLSVVNPWEI